MESIRELLRIGAGPSSSHTMGPMRAAEQFKDRHPDAASYRVVLYGSLAATGMGHLTDVVLERAFAPARTDLVWRPEETMPGHPNAMDLEALDQVGHVIASRRVYSIGGGALRYEDDARETAGVYDLESMEAILSHCETNGLAFWEYVETREGDELRDFLRNVWRVMQDAIERGLHAEGVLPGGLGLARKAWSFHRKALTTGPQFRRTGLLSAYALAVAEENAAGGIIVTAPTCGSCGALPAVLRYLMETLHCGDDDVLRPLATAGLIGNLIKHNASISGAEVGCQGEIGTGCAMAAAAAVQMLGGTNRQIEYAAEMALEHHMGLTCDPVGGLVQIPCIERNAFAATRALTCAQYALYSDGTHRIPFDEVVAVMRQTGHDLPSLYRETASGGLARAYEQRAKRGESPS